MLVVSASVDLSNGCVTNPRVQAPDPGAQPDATGMVTVSVVVDSDAGPGRMCPMIYRPNVAATPLRWVGPPAGLKSVQLVGARRSDAGDRGRWGAGPPRLTPVHHGPQLDD